MKQAERDGQSLSFTKVERLLLRTFTSNPGRLLTRDVLLDAISPDALGTSDRNIDYIVNRLRAKLNDSAKSPRFLATRYGEGYVWIAEPQQEDVIDGFLVIGPVFGIDGEPFETPLKRVIDDLHHRLAKRLPAGRDTVIARHFHPHSAGPGVEYSLELGFLANGPVLHASAILRTVRSWQIVKTLRLRLELPHLAKMEPAPKVVVDWIVNAVVLHKSEVQGLRTAIPLEMSLHEASRLLSLPDQAWVASGEALSQERAVDPGNPKLEVMWASHLYARLIMAGPFGGIDHAARERIENEIEAVCMDCLPAAQTDPVLRLCIAKLLFFVDRHHTELAESLLENSLDENIGAAALYPLLGQLRAARGQFEEALRYYDHALKTADPGSEYQVFVLVLKADTLMAAGRRAEVPAVLREILEVRPAGAIVLGLLMIAPADQISPEQKGFLMQLGSGGGAALADYLHKTTARHYLSVHHRHQVMIGLCTQLQRVFGQDFMPEDCRLPE